MLIGPDRRNRFGLTAADQQVQANLDAAVPAVGGVAAGTPCSGDSDVEHEDTTAHDVAKEGATSPNRHPYHRLHSVAKSLITMADGNPGVSILVGIVARRTVGIVVGGLVGIMVGIVVVGTVRIVVGVMVGIMVGAMGDVMFCGGAGAMVGGVVGDLTGKVVDVVVGVVVGVMVAVVQPVVHTGVTEQPADLQFGRPSRRALCTWCCPSC